MIKEIKKKAIICNKCMKEIMGKGILLQEGSLEIKEGSLDSGYPDYVYLKEATPYYAFHYHLNCIIYNK